MSITVRRATVQDAAAYARIMGDPGVYPGLMQMPYTNEELWRARLADNSTPGTLDLHLVAELDGALVGTAGLHPAGVSQRRRHALTIGISVLTETQGRGVGSALMAALCDYSDHWVGALRLELSVYTDNTRAIGLYQKFGFVIEGTMRGYAMRAGQFTDTHAMARFHPNPPRIAVPPL
nr:GNAT family N-acetyltransferase [Rhodoferax sp.]